MVLVDAGPLFRCAGQHFMCIAWCAVFGRSYLLLYHLLSICLTVGKERVHIPQCNAPENFFSPGYGAAHGCAQEPTRGSTVEFWGKILRRNKPLVPRLNIVSSWTRGGEGTISAIQARSQRLSTCEAHVSLSLFFKEKTQPHDARIHASDSFSSGQLITRRLHRHHRVALRSRFLIELHSSHAPPPHVPCPPPPPPHSPCRPPPPRPNP